MSDKKYKCPECDYQTDYKPSIQDHVELHHHLDGDEFIRELKEKENKNAR